MMVYQYTPIGMNLGRVKGKISYLHDRCAVQLNSTLGPNAIPYDGDVPLDAICPWCRTKIVEEAEV